MPPQISPLSRSLQFVFEGRECLYRGFQGQRVVVDAEGAGILSNLESDVPLTIVRDGETVKEFPTVFRDSITVSAAGEGRVVAELSCDGAPASLPAIRTVQGHVEGSGWVIPGGGRVKLDRRHEWVDLGRLRSPVPFRIAVEGDAEFKVALEECTRCELVDSWNIDDQDSLKSHGWVVQNMSKLRTLDSTFDDLTPRVAQVASHLNAARWTSKIPPDNNGILLRRYYDRFHGRQRARVHVDGQVVGVWYESRENRDRRWAVSDFGILAPSTAGKSEIEITIDPPSGVSLWSVSQVEVWALAPA